MTPLSLSLVTKACEDLWPCLVGDLTRCYCLVNLLQLRKAYVEQVEEIESLKEQLSQKDKRIVELEDEVKMLRHGIIPEATKTLS